MHSTLWYAANLNQGADNEGNPHQRNRTQVVAADVKPDPNKSLDGFRALIGCEWGQPVIVARTLTLWLDEGRLKLPKPGFRLQDTPIDFAGNGVPARRQ